MKYFIDTEFIEGSQTKRLLSIPIGKTKPTIDLISIGIVSEDGREYYAISKDFNLKEAWNRYDIKKEWYSINESTQSTRDIKVYWIRDNVLKPIWEEKCKEGFSFKNSPMTPYGIESLFTYSNFKKLLNKYGKTNKQIAEEVKDFCSIGSVVSKKGNNVYHYKEFKESVKTWIKVEEIEHNNPTHYDNKPVFYGYYCDYDWVVFCWLFGKMIDLPTGFPMYCIDLKQTLDEKEKYLQFSSKHFAILNIKDLPNYPKQINEHNALDDARWNKQLYEFLIKL